MPGFVVPILWGVFAYLLGSLHWSYLAARWAGVDISSVGNRNPGAANVFREVGRVQGIAVLLADGLMGIAAVLPTGWLPLPEVCRVVGTVMVMLGTMYPVFWGFKGGTGLAKGMGAALGINVVGVLLGCVLGLLVVWRFRNSGWSGAVVVVTAFALSIALYRDLAGAGNIVLIAALIFIRSKVQYRSTASGA